LEWLLLKLGAFVRRVDGMDKFLGKEVEEDLEKLGGRLL